MTGRRRTIDRKDIFEQTSDFDFFFFFGLSIPMALFFMPLKCGEKWEHITLLHGRILIFSCVGEYFVMWKRR